MKDKHFTSRMLTCTGALMTVAAFAGPEYMPEKQIRMCNLVGKHISRFFMGRIAKKLGCKEKLDARPYECAVKIRK